jgi:hypothetical protein
MTTCGAYEYTTAYKSLMGVSGGDGCGCDGGHILGSADDGLISVKLYDVSLNAEAKAKIVNGIIEVMKKLGMSDVKTSGSKDEILKSILDNIPSNKNKKKLKASSELHQKLCKALGELINKQFPGQIILDGSPELACQQVAEFIYALYMGLKAEYIGVSEDIETAIANVLLLKGEMDTQLKTLMDQVESSQDLSLRSNASATQGIYKLLDAELERQLAMLQGLLKADLDDIDQSSSWN